MSKDFESVKISIDQISTAGHKSLATVTADIKSTAHHRRRFLSLLIGILVLVHFLTRNQFNMSAMNGGNLQVLSAGDFRLEYAAAKDSEPATDSSADTELSWSLGPQAIVNRLNNTVFSLRITHKDEPEKILWQSLPGRPFVQAAVGNDQLGPGNGEYRIIQNNQHLTTHQTVTTISQDGADVVIRGKLGLVTGNNRNRRGDRNRDQQNTSDSGEGAGKGEQSVVHVLEYTMRFSPYTNKQLRFTVDISSPLEGLMQDRLKAAGNSSTVIPPSSAFDRIILSYATTSDEHPFGLGEQFSLWSLQGHRIPIITREQGIGRGLQPITYIFNHLPPKNPAYAGGDPLSTYTAIPHYITSQSRSLFLLNSELSFFDFTQPAKIQVEVVSKQVRGGILYGYRPFDLINEYTKHISGRMKELPDWITGQKGAVVGIQGGEAKVLRVIEILRQSKVPIAAIWLQDWVGMRNQFMDMTFPIPGIPTRTPATVNLRSTSPQKRLWWNWEYDRHAYPNWPKFVKKLRQDFGIRVMTYINPFLTDVELGGKPHGSFAKNYFREASEKGYLVKKWIQKGEEWVLGDYLVSSGPGLVAGMIDLTNPDAYDWYKSLIKDNMLAFGVAGWMADFGEYLPFDGVIHAQINNGELRPPGSGYLAKDDQTSPHVLHNLYPAAWAKLNEEAIAESKVLNRKEKEECVYFMRSASQTSPGVARAFWNGDQMHTWDHLDGLESSIYATLSAAISGIAYTHSDIGGYTTINVDPRAAITVSNRTTYVKLPGLERGARFVRQDTELFYRWMETSSFISTAMFRTHEGSVPDENLQVWQNPEISGKFRFYTELYQSLFQYRKLLAQEHTKFGYPPVRPLYLHFPQNRVIAEMERLEFMLGPLILVIPITAPSIDHLNQTIVDKPIDEGDEDDEDDGAEKFWDEVRRVSKTASPEHSDGEDQPNINGDRLVSPIDSEENMASSQESLPDHLATISGNSLHPHLQEHQRRHDSLKGQWIDSIKTYFVSSIIGFTNSFMARFAPQPTNQLHLHHGQDSKARQKHRRPVTKSGPIVAPKTVPAPHHGRPFLPQGTWIHVWTMTKIKVSSPQGVFISQRPDIAKLACPVGQPPIFVREISDELMLDVIQTNLLNHDQTKFAEDWLYWTDATDDGSLHNESGTETTATASGEQITAWIVEKRGDELHRVAQTKFAQFQRSLKPFWEFVNRHRISQESSQSASIQ